MFEKTKKFIKDHDEEIIGFAVAAGTLVCIGLGIHVASKYRFQKKLNNNDAMKTIMKVFDDIPDGCKIRAYGGIATTGFAPKELGELGKAMIESGADEVGDIFTHFIAIEKL